MLTRYKVDDSGARPVACVYTSEELGINTSLLDPDAVRSIHKLRQKGFDAYIVGGAIRDLILGIVPKDFDIVTDASPRQIHKIFYDSRIIGKRFKIVHLVFGDKIIEASTFRSLKNGDAVTDNVFGTIDEDAKRRDFTINSLYFNPADNTVIDFNNAIEDFREKRIRSILPLKTTFKEDPVRMLRAVKFSITTGFKMDIRLKWAIKRDASELGSISSSRLTEEVMKILSSGNCAPVFKALDEFGLLAYLMPSISIYSKFGPFTDSLKELDAKVIGSKSKGGMGEDVQKWEYFYYLTRTIITTPATAQESSLESFRDVFRQVKVFISPITPPNIDIEKAIAKYMGENSLRVPKAVKNRILGIKKTPDNEAPRKAPAKKRKPNRNKTDENKRETVEN